MIIKKLIGRHYEIGTYTCGRCGGSGDYPSMEYQGICLKCHGKGKLYGKHLVCDFEEEYIDDDVYKAQLEEKRLEAEKAAKAIEDEKIAHANEITIGYTYIKPWFIKKSEFQLFDNHKYRYDKETEKAIHLIDNYGVALTWCPKSATISVEEHNKILRAEYQEILDELNEDKKVLEIELEKKQVELKEKFDALTDEQKNAPFMLDIMSNFFDDICEKINSVNEKINKINNKINELN